jgi:hypothetical protein
MEPIEYTFVLKSKNGYITSTGAQKGDTANGVNNTDLTYYMHNFFQSLSAIPNCNCFKFELVGGLFTSSVGVTSIINGINIGFYIDGCVKTTASNSSVKSEIILGGFNNELASANGLSFVKMTSEMVYNSPLYIRDITQSTTIRINLKIAIRIADTTGNNTPAYSLMFKVTPILN